MLARSVFVLAFVALVNTDLIRVPLQKRNTHWKSLEEHRTGRSAGVRSYPSVINANLYLYGKITIGTPPQNFDVMVDTASEILWVPSSKSSNSVLGGNRYNSSASSTYKSRKGKVSISFNRQFYTGSRCVDTVNVGGLSIVNQTFAVTTDITTESSQYDGVFGLDLEDNSGYIACPFRYMCDQGLLEREVFSLYFARNSSIGGELIFGGSDRNLYDDDLVYVPLRGPRSWIFNMDLVTLEGESLCGATCVALPDTGSPLIVLPDRIFAKLKKKMDVLHEDNGVAFLNCSKAYNLPSVNFYISGKRFTIAPSAYVISFESEGQTHCILGFTKWNSATSIWLLGNIFMREFYTEFDFGGKRIGFSRAN